MKKLPAILIVAAIACTEAFAYQVKVVYNSKDYPTNFFTSVPDGEYFYYGSKITKGEDIKNFEVRRIPPQKYDKNVALIVGVERAEGEMFAYNDTGIIANICETIFCDNKYTLNNSQATKDTIRNYLQFVASKLSIRDTFVFYFSGTITSEGGLQCYDEIITKEELFADLALFSTDCRIVIIADADNAEKLLDSDPAKNIIFIYCGKNISKKYKEKASPFTLALDRSFNNISDGDQNGLLSFSEMFSRARNFIIAQKYKVTPYYKSGTIESPLYWAAAPDHECDGTIQINNGQFLVTVPSIDSDTEVEITEGSWEGIFPIPTITKCSLQANLKINPYPTKFSLDYKMYPNAPDPFSYAVYLNNQKIPVGRKIKESASSLIYAIENYEFKTVGKLTIKRKTGAFKIIFKDASYLADAFTWDSGQEFIQVAFRDYSILFHETLPFDKTYKTGKSLTAKFPRKK